MEALPPRILQLVGLGGLLVCFAFWMVTQRVATEFITVFGGLASFGLLGSAVQRNGREKGESR